jgi:hypothetical protein
MSAQPGKYNALTDKSAAELNINAASAYLTQEAFLLSQSKARGDTAETFIDAMSISAALAPAAAKPFRKPYRTKVAFFVSAPYMLAHVVNLHTYLTALRETDIPIDPVIFVAGTPSDEFVAAFKGFKAYSFPAENQAHYWLHAQKACEELRLDALVHVSVAHGMAFAANIRCARKHIYWAMKWHAAVPGVDGYISGTDPLGEPRRVAHGGAIWRCVYTSLPDLESPALDVEARVVRERFGPGKLFGTTARNEKYSPEFVRTVGRILDAQPDAQYAYAARRPVDGMHPRAQYLGWVDARLWVRVPDMVLDPFPFPGGHVTFEAAVARRPMVLMRVQDPQQVFLGDMMDRRGFNSGWAWSEYEYVDKAAQSDKRVDVRADFVRMHLRDTKRMAREVSDAILEICGQ